MALFHSRSSARYAAAAGAPSASPLRVKDVAFSANQIVVRDDKGHSDRVTFPPAAVKACPGRKYPNAGPRYLHDIRTTQERLGLSDVSTTVIYTHVLNRGPAGVTSRADRVLEP